MADITIANVCFGAADEEGKVGYIPLGPLYVTAALEKEGYIIDFRDYLVGSQIFSEPLNPASLLTFLEDSCQIVGIGCTSGTLPFVITALADFKAQYPEKTIILGGIGPTGAAEEIIWNFPFIDIVVKGEGEETIVAVINRLENGRDLKGVPGIAYRKNENTFTNPIRKWIEELDTVPFPAYRMVDPSRYSIKGIATSRGCPYCCTFCDTAPFWGRRCRTRSVDNVIAEMIRLYEKYGVRNFEFVDDTFVLNKDRVMAFCQRLKRLNFDFQWTCCGRINLMDAPMMKAMADSGCTMVFYGMESGSNKILMQINKEFTREQSQKVITQSSEYFDVYVSFIWGFPFETMKDFQDTIDCTEFVSKLGGTPWLFPLAPLPLSPLYREYKDRLVFSEEWAINMAGAGKERIMDLLRRYPGIFSGFYRYPTENFSGKYDMIKECGLVNRSEQTVFLDGLIVSKWD